MPSVAYQEHQRNSFMEQNTTIINPQGLLKILRDKCKTEREVRNKSRLSRTTIHRIDKGETEFDPATLGKLVKAINE